MPVHLDLYSGATLTLSHRLTSAVTTLGSNPACDLCVPTAGVAGVQANILHDGVKLRLLNLAKDGTRVSGEDVYDDVPLAQGDEIALGGLRMVVRWTDGRDSRTQTLAHGPAVLETPHLVLPGVTEGIPLRERGVTVGTAPHNDVVLRDEYVSANHARISLERGRVMVRDMGSRNGTFLGAQRVEAAEVGLGGTITVGKTTLVVKGATDPEEHQQVTFVGSSSRAAQVREMIARAASNEAPVLITGETGTGKEVVASLLAGMGPRSRGPYVALNCGALSASLIESELFGHEKGAFTDAVAKKRGAFETAHQGTLFLDEIGELPLALQAPLLRAVELGEIKPVGAAKPFRVSARVVAATNRNLEREIRRGRFRQDLYHRLNVLTIAIPPLRERLEDVPALASHFLRQLSPEGVTLELGPGVPERLQSHRWPGNVRELRNVVQRAVLLRRGNVIELEDVVIPEVSLESRLEAATAKSTRTLAEIERDAIVQALIETGGNRTEAAVMLGVSRATMHRRIEALGIDPEELEDPSD